MLMVPLLRLGGRIEHATHRTSQEIEWQNLSYNQFPQQVF